MFNKTCFLYLFASVALCDEIRLKENIPWNEIKIDNRADGAIPWLSHDPIILEVGVDVGQHTRYFKKIWPNATVYGFEPVPSSFEAAKRNTQDLENVFLYNSALFNQEGNLTFFLSQRNAASSSLFPDNSENVRNPHVADVMPYPAFRDKEITVVCTTIDRWAEISGVSHIDYLWIDSLGAEIHILEAATTILPNVKVISVECNFQEFRKGIALFPELYHFLTEKGFTLKHIMGDPQWVGEAIFVNNKLL